MLVELLFLIALLIVLFCRWATANNDFFKQRGIAHEKPCFLLGSAKDMLLGRKSFFNMVVEIYNKSDEKVYGIFEMRVPLIVVKDPNIIKQIVIKDFDHFINRRTFASDDLFGNGLFQLRDAKWKDMRHTLTPIFSGNKMRYLFGLITEVTDSTIAYMKKQPDIVNAKGYEVDMKDFATRYVNDIIASTVFGLLVNSFEERENKFYMMGKKMMNFGLLQNIKFFMASNCGKLMKFLRVPIFDREQASYFKQLVVGAMKHRVENNIKRSDVIQMLLEAQGVIKSEHFNAPVRNWSEVEIIAQCFVFFFAGFESSSSLLCFVAHELVENPLVQEKLYAEISDVETQLAGAPLNYDALLGMKYLDMVISETLRKWPIAVFIERICNKDIVYEENGDRLELKAGDIVWLPAAGIQRDAKYYEEPDKFDPERFNDENKHNINPYIYFPFGLGPRSCIANRFAILKSKVLLYNLLREFRIEATARTTIPLTQLSAKTFQLLPPNGFWLKFVQRNSSSEVQ